MELSSRYKFPKFLIALLLVWFIASLIVLVATDKIQFHQSINNQLGNPFVDPFFKYFTFLGDGITAAIICALTLVINKKKGLYLLCVFLTAALITQILKNFVFDAGYDRPLFVFERLGIPLKEVKGAETNILNSFPSGHSTAAFAIYVGIAFLSKSKLTQVLLLGLAITIGFSRIYLTQHFLMDVVAGSFIACVCIMLYYYLFYVRKPEFLSKFDNSLF